VFGKSLSVDFRVNFSPCKEVLTRQGGKFAGMDLPNTPNADIIKIFCKLKGMEKWKHKKPPQVLIVAVFFFIAGDNPIMYKTYICMKPF